MNGLMRKELGRVHGRYVHGSSCRQVMITGFGRFLCPHFQASDRKPSRHRHLQVLPLLLVLRIQPNEQLEEDGNSGRIIRATSSNLDARVLSHHHKADAPEESNQAIVKAATCLVPFWSSELQGRRIRTETFCFEANHLLISKSPGTQDFVFEERPFVVVTEDIQNCVTYHTVQ